MQRMVSIALSLVLSSSYAFLADRGIAESKSTVEIDITNKQYQPPPTTLKIPAEFSNPASTSKGVLYARLAVRDGDTLKICNHDQLTMKPFSLNKGFTNFKAPGGQLKPGQCMTYVVHDNGNDPVLFKLFDELHARNKLFLVVLPARWPDQGRQKTPPGPPVDLSEYPVEQVTRPDKLTLTLASTPIVVQLKWSGDKLTTGRYTPAYVPEKVDQTVTASASLDGTLPAPYVMWMFVARNGTKGIDGQCGPTTSGCDVQVPAYPGRARGYGDGWAASVEVEVWICKGSQLQACPGDPAAMSNINWHL